MEDINARHNYFTLPVFSQLNRIIMPVNSKKQGQGQTGKKGDDAKTKAKKENGKENTFGPTKESAATSKSAKK